ncbi:MAG: hypothetical protein ACXVH2_09585 [Methanobacterium sp.]
MEIVNGVLNAYYVNKDLLLTDATESQFKELLDNFVFEKESKGKKDFIAREFALYASDNGYHIYTHKSTVLPPRQKF